MTKKAQARQQIEILVKKFSENLEEFMNPKFNEEQTKQSFLNPFWRALGWNIEDHREVSYEIDLKVDGNNKRPDYEFKISGQRYFFVDAKKPSINIKNDQKPAFQIRRYGWSAAMPLSIISNFAEFAVYDCLQKPFLGEDAFLYRIKYLTFDNYLAEFDFLYDHFAKENVQKNLDKLARLDSSKKGNIGVDQDFLETLTDWRKILAEDIFRFNPNLIGEDINYAVQMLINRLLFLRICESRNMAVFKQLLNIIGENQCYPKLLDEFRLSQERYNSGLFDFQADKISQNLKVSDSVLLKIIPHLYYPNSPYEFSVIPVEIIGNAYEQFLGYEILISDKTLEISAKPEVKKAGGVFYTPQYVVNYIIEQTIGQKIKEIEEKTDKKQIPQEIAKLRILDPACGSGSFLLGAYQYLLDYYQNFYVNLPKNSPILKGKNILNPYGKLTTTEKKRILKSNIFGVDIDERAVEIAKFSLLLAALAGENEESIKHQIRIYREKALPNIDENIICGNSLIAWDYEEEDQKKNKPLDWETAFSQLFDYQGFDIVIGNPPWGAEFSENSKKYLVQRFPNIPTKTKDSYLYFINMALQIVKNDHFIGFITPNTWLLINNAKNFRKLLLDFEIRSIIDHGDGVFPDATVESLTFILRKKIAKSLCFVQRFRKGKLIFEQNIHSSIWLSDELFRIVLEQNQEKIDLLSKIRLISERFDANCEIIWGIKPYQVGHGKPAQTREVLENRIFHSKTQIDSLWKPLLVGKNVNRYAINLEKGIEYIKYGEWLMYTSNEKKMLAPKILLRQTSANIKAVYDKNGYYCQNSVFILTSNKYELKYLLALLNSKLFDFIYKSMNPQENKIFAEIKPKVIKSFPIKIVDFENQTEQKLYKQIVSQIDKLLELNQTDVSKQILTARQQHQQQIKYLENQIDKAVFALYGLSDSEIEIVKKG